MRICIRDIEYTNFSEFIGPWRTILYDFHVRFKHEMASNFNNEAEHHVADWTKLFLNRSFNEVFDIVEFVLQHPSCDPLLPARIEGALRDSRCAYRLVGKTLVPISNEHAALSISGAFNDAARAKLPSVGAHLEAAGKAAREGAWAASVRESIHAVESVAVRIARDGATLGEALRELEQSGYLHSALKKALSALYGYANDEEGIRHALVFEGKPNVDEADALFMLGACASCVAYLISKGQSTGAFAMRPTST